MSDPKSLVDMIEQTDIHAMRRVSRMFGRMMREAERHQGHGESCPFDRQCNRDDVFMTKDALDTLIDTYEQEHGVVPNYPFVVMGKGSGTPVA